MKVVVENEKENYILQVGDILIKDEKLPTVIESRKECRFSVVKLGQVDTRNITRNTLKELTIEAIAFNYKMYSKDEYEIVIRKIK